MKLWFFIDNYLMSMVLEIRNQKLEILIRPYQPGDHTQFENPIYANQAIAVTCGISLIHLVGFKCKQAITVTCGIGFINLIPRKGVQAVGIAGTVT